MGDRHLEWPGCFNARDLGGLRTVDGRLTRRRAIVRADGLDGLTPEGWQALRAYGIRTIVDLRNDDEIGERGAQPGLTRVHLPIDDVEDSEFWRYCWSNELDGTPLYYKPFLDAKPDRCAAAIAAIARAEPGGVLFHCSMGRDRTGLVAMLVLALVGVSPEEIAADYLESGGRLSARAEALGEQDWGPVGRDLLAARGTSAEKLIHEILSTVDLESHLRSAGLESADIRALRTRLLQ